MNTMADSLFWLRTVAYLTTVGVAVSLALAGSVNLVGLLCGIGVFGLALPVWPWARTIPPAGLFGVLFFEAILISSGQFLSDHPGTVMTLFFVLLPICARLPRRYSLLCYTAFPLIACLPPLLATNSRLGWAVIVEVLPGFLAMIAFSEGYWAFRDTLRAKQTLLDELVAAQRRQADNEHPGNSGQAAAGEPPILTRRDREVLSLVAVGFSNKEIAERLFLAEGTVKNRVSQILEKIGARDRTQAALRARDLGLI